MSVSYQNLIANHQSKSYQRRSLNHKRVKRLFHGRSAVLSDKEKQQVQESCKVRTKEKLLAHYHVGAKEIEDEFLRSAVNNMQNGQRSKWFQSISMMVGSILGGMVSSSTLVGLIATGAVYAVGDVGLAGVHGAKKAYRYWNKREVALCEDEVSAQVKKTSELEEKRETALHADECISKKLSQIFPNHFVATENPDVLQAENDRRKRGLISEAKETMEQDGASLDKTGQENIVEIIRGLNEVKKANRLIKYKRKTLDSLKRLHKPSRRKTIKLIVLRSDLEKLKEK